MEKKPTFSVVIPAYNHERYIGDCIQSVLDQTCDDFELIIINDGSSDKTEEIIKNFSDERIKYFYQENHDAPYTINRGIQMAEGKYVAILNSDDLFEKDKLEKSLAVLDQGHEFVFGKLRVVNEDNELIGEDDERVKWINEKLNNHKEENLLEKLLLNINFIVTTSNFVFEKSITEKVGFFHEKLHYSHDFDFLLRVITSGTKIKFIPEFIASYRMHSDNTLSKGKAEAILEACYSIMKLIEKKYFPINIADQGFYKMSVFSNTIAFLSAISEEERERVVENKENINRKRALENINHWLFWDRKIDELIPDIKRENNQLKSQIALMKSSKFWKMREGYLKTKNVFFKKDIDHSSLVSVVIPCYNYGKFIEEAISSVLASTYQNIEIIVVDDGPTDQFTIDLLKDLNKPKTRVIFQKNQGLARARNNGISQAVGEFILSLDADDKIDPTYIEKALYVLEKNPKLGLAYGYVQVFGNENLLWKTGKYNIERLTKENIIPSCSLFRKRAWKEVGGYENDRHQYDDWTFWLKLASHGFYGQLIPEVLFFHRKHPGQANMTDKLREKHEEYYNKIKAKFPKLFKKKRVNPRHFYKIISLVAHRVFPKKITKILFELKRFILNHKNNKNFETDFDINNYKIQSKKINKLLVFLPWTIRGGAEKVTLDIIRNFSDWDIFVVTTIENEYDSAVDLDFKNITKNIYHLPNFLNREDYLPFVQGLIKQNGIDVALINHCAWAYENMEEIKAAVSNIKFFDLLHNTAPEGYKSYSLKYNKFITKTISISNEIEQHLINDLKIPEKKVTCILNGVDVSNVFNPINADISKTEKEFSFPKNKKGISFIGRLSPEKNPLKFVNVATAINKAYPDEYFFIMVGGGDLMAAVAGEVNRHFNKSVFFVLGNHSNPEKILSASSFLINTSSIEGMPLTIIEALSMDVPVIAPSVGAIHEIIEDGYNGYLLSKNPSVENYLEAINKSRENGAYFQLKSKARPSVMDKYSSEIMAKKYQDVFLNK